MALTLADLKEIGIIGIVASSLSIISCLFVIITFILFPAIRNFKSKLIVYLNVSVLIWVTFTFVGMCYFVRERKPSEPLIPEGYCKTQGFFLQWFVVSYVSWVFTMAVYLNLRVQRSHWLDDHEWVAHAFCWIFPLILAIIPLFGVGKGYGVAGAWCWIKDPMIRLILAYLPIWACFLAVCGIYIRIYFFIRNTGVAIQRMSDNPERAQKERKKLNTKVLRKLAFYPILFIILWIPGTINRIHNEVDPLNPKANLFKVHVFFVWGTGFFNVFIYGFFNMKYVINRTWSKTDPTNSGSINTAPKSNTESERGSVSI